jgi:membrane associated rhomboid family serine protease
MYENEPKKKNPGLLFPVYFVLAIWIVMLLADGLGLSLSHLGVYPLRLDGLQGLLFSPLIHGDYGHLMANTIPLVVLGLGLFYFYPREAYFVFFAGWLLSGLGTWIIGRESYHIGASGIIYALAGFLFFSGVLRNDIRLLSISLIVVFLYGSMVWGVLPIRSGMSWEGHLSGMAAGVIMAWYYRNADKKDKGGQRSTGDHSHYKRDTQLFYDYYPEDDD